VSVSSIVKLLSSTVAITPNPTVGKTNILLRCGVSS
jgi:hypothetical protein